MDYTRPVQTLIPGVQGQILGVLAETTAQLNLTTVSRLSGVSPAQASRVLPELVRLGLVERVEAPPSALFRLMDQNLVGQLVRSMADLRFLALEAVGDYCARQKPRPDLAVVFGSFARGDADADSDLDVVIVRPSAIDHADVAWSETIVTLNQDLALTLGNPVNILEVAAREFARRLKSHSELWRSIRSEGIVVFGDAPAHLQGMTKVSTRSPRTKPTTPKQARAYASKSEEYLAAAERELTERLHIAATSLAIHAAINAADAVCGIRLGKRSGGQTHEEVLGLLATAGADGREVAKELGRVLPLKTKAEYDPVDVSRTDAGRAVERARRCVAIARRVVDAQAR